MSQCEDFVVLLRGDESDRMVRCDVDHAAERATFDSSYVEHQVVPSWHGAPVPPSTDGHPFDGVSAPMLPLHATLELTLPPHVGPRVEWRYRQ